MMFPQTTTAREIQRNYRRIFDRVKRTKKPVVVMRNNKPEVAIIDIKELEKIEAIVSVRQSRKEYAQGKGKTLTSIADLLK